MDRAVEVLRGESLRAAEMLDLQTPQIRLLLSFEKLGKDKLRLLV